MNYYKIDRIIIDKTIHKAISSANGENVPNGKYYFDRIGKGEIITDAPIFDYFFLQSFAEKEEWEWRLQDVHGFMGEYPPGNNWYISDDLKLLLENFKIAYGYSFYETRLLYKDKKLNYWIFQFPISPFQNIYFPKSTFILDDDDKIYSFFSETDYLTFYRQEYRSTRRKLKIQCQVLKSFYDLFITSNNDKLVSENLKTAIETMGITGFEFSEIDYEVITI